MSAERSVVDLRSDTLTRPTPAMREALAQAEVGDDVYAEDPTVNALEARVAELLGHEAGLFTASGSMANLLATSLLVRPGTELLCDARAHVVRAELGAHAAVGQVTTRTFASPRGLLDAASVLDMATPDAGPYLVATAAVAVENTHNFGGGTVQPIEEIEALRAGALELGMSTHLDGARLWNAHVATGVPLRRYGRAFDTVAVCFSKGLGAPVGSMLVSSGERIAAARVLRKRYGGGMRQVGVLAAACEYALDRHLDLLAADHARARVLAEAVASADPRVVNPAAVETNIVVLDLRESPHTADDVAERAGKHGVRISVLGPRTARLVTHLDVDDEETARAAAVLAAAVAP
jgi:threonine aldolase